VDQGHLATAHFLLVVCGNHLPILYRF